MQTALKIAVVLSAVDRMSKTIADAVNKSAAKLQSLGDKSMELGRATLGSGLAMGAALAVPIKAATEFESGMTNIRKVVDGLRDETAFKEFSADVLKLGRELPLAYDEITEMVAASGRMGIAKQDLIAYTREVGKMAIAFEMSAADAGKSMGKISNIFGIPKQEIGKLADALNTLDDATSAEGKDIIDIMQRVGGTAKTMKMAPTQLAALGTAFLELADTPEVASTAIQAFMAKLGTATLGDKKFQGALKVLGLDPKQLEADMASGKAQEVINTVMAGLNKVADTDKLKVATQLFGLEHFDSATKLAAGLDSYKKAMDAVQAKGADGKFAYEGSIEKEYQARMKTTAVQMKLFKNNVSELSINLGTALLPAVNSVLQSLKPLVDSVRDWAARNPELVAGIGKVVAVLAATTLATSGLSFVFGGLFKVISVGMRAFAAIRTAITMIGGGFKLVTKLGGALKFVIGGVIKVFGFLGTALRAITAAFMTNPIGFAIAAIATAVYLIYEYWTPLKEFFVNLWGGIKDVFGNVWEWLKGMASAFYEAGKNLLVYLWEGMKSMFSRVKDGFVGFIRGDLVGAVEGLTGGAVSQALEAKRQEAFLNAGQPTTGGGLAGFALSGMRRAGGLPEAANRSSVINLNYAPTINGVGGALGAAQGILEKDKQEMLRILQEQQARSSRKTFQ